MKLALLCLLMFPTVLTSCAHKTQEAKIAPEQSEPKAEVILPGIYKVDSVAAGLRGKAVGVISNHTGLIGDTHIVDTLLALDVNVKGVFSPEHGFRGDVPDGDLIDSDKDPNTGLPLHSLYGKTKKPTVEMLEGLDVLLFDIQDVGARFYTYLSTLHYVMEAAAENNIQVVVLDRPNPNGFYIDGPVLRPEHKSFIGLHPVPVVYGMTIGEYAQMINGEKWLAEGQSCDLSIVTCEGYSHASLYKLPVKPSPNLPDMESIYLYPSICFFEGTTVSVGRGTDTPFSIIGEPSNTEGDFTFTPEPKPGASVNPKHNGEKCTGYNLRAALDFDNPPAEIQLDWLCNMYNATKDTSTFFNANLYFDKLAGNSDLRKFVLARKSCEEIHESWKAELDAFKKVRAKYLIYP